MFPNLQKLPLPNLDSRKTWIVRILRELFIAELMGAELNFADSGSQKCKFCGIY